MQNVIQQSLDLLADDNEWASRYEKYLDEIWANSKKVSKGFRKPRGLSLYSTVGDRNNLIYILRFRGQTVGKVKVTSSGVFLKSEILSDSKYFVDCPLKKREGYKDWNSNLAHKFRSYFNRLRGRVDIKSPEHVVENSLLEEFKKRSSKNKAIINIQPICLHGQFFQMPTPLSASKKELKYAKQRGGGIDMLTRIVTKDDHIRLCVAEIKDDNIPAESQCKAMSQAVAYATFIAKLVTEQPDWWEFFMKHDEKKDNNVAKLDKRVIEVVTIMPSGSTETCENKDFEIKSLGITLHCRSLYYDKDKYEASIDSSKNNGETLFTFTGTFLDEIKR